MIAEGDQYVTSMSVDSPLWRESTTAVPTVRFLCVVLWLGRKEQLVCVQTSENLNHLCIVDGNTLCSFLHEQTVNRIMVRNTQDALLYLFVSIVSTTFTLYTVSLLCPFQTQLYHTSVFLLGSKDTHYIPRVLNCHLLALRCQTRSQQQLNKTRWQKKKENILFKFAKNTFANTVFTFISGKNIMCPNNVHVYKGHIL